MVTPKSQKIEKEEDWVNGLCLSFKNLMTLEATGRAELNFQILNSAVIIGEAPILQPSAAVLRHKKVSWLHKNVKNRKDEDWVDEPSGALQKTLEMTKLIFLDLCKPSTFYEVIITSLIK